MRLVGQDAVEPPRAGVAVRVAVSDAAGRLNDHRRLRTCDAAAAVNNDDYNDIIIIIDGMQSRSHQHMNNMYMYVCI